MPSDERFFFKLFLRRLRDMRASSKRLPYEIIGAEALTQRQPLPDSEPSHRWCVTATAEYWISLNDSGS